MDMEVKTIFMEKWAKYFPGNELPLACYYSDELNGAGFHEAPKPNQRGYTCVFSQLAPVRSGDPRAFNQDNFGCWGATAILGFGKEPTPEEMEFTVDFLVNEEKFKKTREHVMAMFAANPPMKAQDRYLVFKRWDILAEDDEPQVVLFFCSPDAIGGLHTLANFDTNDPHGVIVPFGSGCDSLVGYSMKELESDEPRAVIGLFDPPARACVKPNLLNFSIPWPKFLTMLQNMDDCFLNTFVWEPIQKRLKLTGKV